jgi:hypothetical protein
VLPLYCPRDFVVALLHEYISCTSTHIQYLNDDPNPKFKRSHRPKMIRSVPSTAQNTRIDGRSHQLVIPKNPREEACREVKPKKSYLKRENPEKERSDRRRNLIEQSVQNFLPPTDKPLLVKELHDDSALHSPQSPSGRGTGRAKGQRKGSNFISSLFLTPRNRKREKVLREKGKRKNNQRKRAPIPEVIFHFGEDIVPLDESLSDFPATDKTASTESSSGSEPVQRTFQSESTANNVPTTANRFKSALKSPSWRNNGRRSSWVNKSIPEDGPPEGCLGIQDMIEQLPIEKKLVESNQLPSDEDHNHSTTALHYIDGTDWAGLEWSALLPPSPNNVRQKASRRMRRASYSGGTQNAVDYAAAVASRTKRKPKMGRRASCSAFP